MKIGLIADTHMPGSIDVLWPQVARAFEGVELILHAGDLHTLDIVDHLGEIAPVYVARGNGDLDIIDERLQDSWLLERDGLHIGLIHHFPSPIRKSSDHLEKYLHKHFPEQLPDILIYGHTHLEDVRTIGGRLFINPGSPTLPRNQTLRLGTIATVEISPSQVTTTILQLTEDGVEHHDEFAPHQHLK